MSYAVQWKHAGSTIWHTWSTHDRREAADAMAWVMDRRNHWHAWRVVPLTLRRFRSDDAAAEG